MTQQSNEGPRAEHRWNSPIVLSIVAAAVAGFLNVGATVVKGFSDNSIEQRRSDNSLILEMIRGPSPEQSAENLKFIVDAGLISKKETKKALAEALGSSSLPGIVFLPYGMQLPHAPDYLRECAASATAEIPEGPLTNAATVELVAKMRTSELGKGRCASNWQAWYESLLNIRAGADS